MTIGHRRCGAFIVCTGKCGSTLLSNILNRHAGVLSLSEFFLSIGPELLGEPDRRMSERSFRRLLTRPRRGFGELARRGIKIPGVLYPFESGTFDWSTVPAIGLVSLPQIFLEDTDVVIDEFESSATGSSNSIVGHLHRTFGWLCDRVGARIWVERSGGNLAYVDRLISAFPECKFIHLFRDGADCATSLSRHPLFRLSWVRRRLARELGFDPYSGFEDINDARQYEGAPFVAGEPLCKLMPESLEREALMALDIPLCEFAKMWSAMVVKGVGALEELPEERVLHISYDDLVAAPELVLGIVAEFIGMENPRRWARNYRGDVLRQRDVGSTARGASRSELMTAGRHGYRALSRLQRYNG